jgi:hypothetical protein
MLPTATAARYVSRRAAPALTYLQAGFSLLPIKLDGSKGPTLQTWDEFNGRRPSREEAHAWFGRLPTPGIALIGGKVSGGRC